MNRFYLITLGVVIILGIIGAIILSMRDNRQDLAKELAKASAEFKEDEAEIAKASANFKSNSGFRYEPAKKLIPHLKTGMTTQEVSSLLGIPDNERKFGDGILYEYSLFYSQLLEVIFDANGNVQKIIAPQGM